jgi:hypothetical protein
MPCSTRNLILLLIGTIAMSFKPGFQDDGRKIRIPVVVHVIYSDSIRDNGVTMHSRLLGNSSQYLSNEKILAELQELNLDFQRLNPDTISIIQEYQKISGNPNISFVLREIKRVKADKAELERLDDNRKHLYSLSPRVGPDSILNVYISYIKIDGKSTNGVSPVKTQLGADAHSLCINYKWVGLGYHLLTHETGHWLGLWHTFNKNSLKDGIDDIPLQSKATNTACEKCPPAVSDNLQTPSTFKSSNFNNFMD